MQARGKGGKGQANGGKGGKGGKGQPAVTLAAAETTALAVRAAHTLSSQDIVKRQKRTGKELRQMLAPVLDGDEEPQPGATALVKILTLSERAALRDNGPLGQIALEAIPAVLQEEAESQGGPGRPWEALGIHGELREALKGSCFGSVLGKTLG